MDRKKFNRLYVTPILPYKPGSYDIDTDALRKFLRYFMQPKFIDAGGGFSVISNEEIRAALNNRI